MEGVISKEVAVVEINRWLDYKKLKPKARVDNADQIELLVEAVVDGSLIVEKNCELKYKLQFPLENDKQEVTVKELVFKPRMNVRQLNSKMKGVKATDADARLVAYAAALSDKPMAIIENLDTADYKIAQNITLFFL